MIERGEYEEGIAFLNKRIAQAGGGDRDKLFILKYLVLLNWYADREQEATENCRKALGLATTLGLQEEAKSLEGQLVIIGLYGQASALKAKKDLTNSNISFEKAWLLSKSSGSQSCEIKILRAWSSNYLGSATALKKYLEMNVQALDLARSLNYRVEACRAEYNIGTYYHIKSSLSFALSHYLRAFYQIRDLRPTADTFKCLNNIASVYISLGNYDKAHDYISEALRLNDARDSGSFRSSLLINLGQAFLSLARRFQTPEYYRQALECFTSYLNLQERAGGKDLDLHALNGIAAIYVDQGRLDEAKTVLLPAVEKARTDKTSALSGMTLLNLAAIALKSGQVAEAERYYRSVLEVARQNNYYLRLIRAAYGLGRCAELSGRDDLAIASYNEAIGVINDKGSSIVNDADRAEFISRSREPYQVLIELYYRLSTKGSPEAFEREIYRVAESLRAWSFLEQLERQARPTDSGRTEPFPSEADRLNAERLDLLRQLSRKAGNADRAQTESLQLRLRHIDDMLDAGVFDKQLRHDLSSPMASPVSLSVLQSAILSDRTALVEYFLGDERSFLMCVTKSAFHLAELPSAQAIEDSLVAYLNFLEDPSIPAAKGLPAARRLYQELLQPVASVIPGDVDRLVIVPDGILFRLPFETLVPEASGSAPTVYLNDRYVISYAPSASSLLYLREAPKKPYQKEALAFGVSEYGPSGSRQGAEDLVSATAVLNDLYKRNGFTIGPLPYARTEVEDLARRVRPEQIDLYYGERATEAAFKRLDLKAYRLIHLACHAFSDDRYPLRSSLVLPAGGGSEEDGFLQVSELYGMKTSADLIVLSACQTGRGKIVRNEGILGLPRIFFYMGARSVIATLWPIHDKAGAVFMDYFYSRYFRGAGKAESLQAAKRKMAGTKYAHPYYWASYTLTGEF
jgi:CHAT domain-containing protein/tetratricopeptide (TPR) repeat protein